MRRLRRFLALVLVLPGVTSACARGSRPAADVPAPMTGVADRPMRIAIAGRADNLRISATGAWELVTEPGGELIAGEGKGDAVELVYGENGALLIKSGASAAASSAISSRGVIRARTTSPDELLLLGSRRYRGSLIVASTDSGLLAINVVPLEQYLEGVVPIEIGNRADSELAAVEAQAVAARSYAVRHRLTDVHIDGYDMVATVLNQAYGGVESESEQASRAIRNTDRLVLEYGGRVIEAPYSSTCGGHTASAAEAWGSAGVPYLTSVSDQIPGSARFYCDISPSFSWTRSWTRDELASSIADYAVPYRGAAASLVRNVTSVRVLERFQSSRVARLELETDRGEMHLNRNEIRFSLRDKAGGILPSTSFDVKLERDGAGKLTRVVFTGRGNGHGVGMCQWGAIGRARAGQDFRHILEAYYPGTKIASLR